MADLVEETGASSLRNEDAPENPILLSGCVPNSINEHCTPSDRGIEVSSSIGVSEQRTVSNNTEITNDEMGIPATPEQRSLTLFDESDNEDGYDSDGCIGPFFDAVKDEDDLINDDEVEVGVAIDAPIEAAAENILTEEEISKMKVVDLKEELKKRACSVRGRKQELVSRLIDAVK